MPYGWSPLSSDPSAAGRAPDVALRQLLIVCVIRVSQDTHMAHGTVLLGVSF